jgi:ubiquinone/menaquinone biosynthesis C-methylase UbiE
MIDYLAYIQCLRCKSALRKDGDQLICTKCAQKYKLIDDKIIQMMSETTPDLELSIKKWDDFYANQINDETYGVEYESYKKMHLDDIIKQLKEVVDYKNKVYLEIGCGPFFLGQNLAKDCALVVGIDFCPSALKIAKKMMDEKGIENYLLIQGDVMNLPFKSDSMDIIYGGGVIEHFKNTQKCINELYRVLKKNGISFNTVPYLNIGSLTYRQVWGNIPNAPILKQIAEFIHIKLLKGRHMIFGYEMSFLTSTLKKVHKLAGFQDVKVEKFDVKMTFDFAPKFMRKYFIWIAKRSRLFWPMVKVIGKK